MRDLTYDELIKAPTVVQYIYMNSLQKIPIGYRTLNEGIENYPEYFPDEVEHRKKWKVVPQNVHDAYWKEREEIYNKVMKDVPKGYGLLWHIENPQESEIVQSEQSKAFEKLKPLEKSLHEKYYGKYGL